jgi:hypothetical protein
VIFYFLFYPPIISLKKIEKLFSIKTNIISCYKMSNINLDFVQAAQPSFFVHFAYANVTEEMISQTLEALNLGSIREISLKPATNKKNERGNSIVVHFNQWFRNSTSDKVRQKLISGESIKINYNPKAYLQVIAFQPKVKVPEAKPQAFKQPTITFDDDDFGPKLGPDCTEKFNTPKVKCDERPRQQRDERPRQPRDERPRQQPRDERPRQPRDERPRQQPRDERPRQQRDDRPVKHYRPITPEGPPPSPETTEPKVVVYHYHNTTPDVFDKNEDITSRGVIIPQFKKRQIQTREEAKPKPQPTPQIQVPRKPINFQDSPSDSEDDDYEEGEEEFILEELEREDEELQALYGDMGKIDLNK